MRSKHALLALAVAAVGVLVWRLVKPRIEAPLPAEPTVPSPAEAEPTAAKPEAEPQVPDEKD